MEVQALVAPAGGFGAPRRTVSGIDTSRLALLVAVLARRVGLDLGGQDIYASLAGGLSVAEPALDLPLALALASSFRDAPVAAGTRPVRRGRACSASCGRSAGSSGGCARRRGWDSAAPSSRPGRAAPTRRRSPGLEIVPVPTLQAALAVALGPARRRRPAPKG